MTTLKMLKAAREMISGRHRWIRGAVAMSIANQHVLPWEPDAVCWCSLGALQKTGAKSKLYCRSFALLAEQMDMNVAGYNDTHTHAEVMAAFDRAIAAEEAK